MRRVGTIQVKLEECKKCADRGGMFEGCAPGVKVRLEVVTAEGNLTFVPEPSQTGLRVWHSHNGDPCSCASGLAALGIKDGTRLRVFHEKEKK